MRLAEERAKNLEAKLAASEQARVAAETRAKNADELQAKLEAAERALEDKTKYIADREAAVIKRFQIQCEKFTGKIVCRADRKSVV